MTVAEFKSLGKKRPKYGNVKCVADGLKFDSKAEMVRYFELKQLREAGAILWFITQPPFKLDAGITYRADFLIVWAPYGGLDAPRGIKVTVEDVKGFMTAVSLLKIRQVEARYPIKVEIISAKSRG